MHAWARIRGRNSNTQFVMGFNDVLIIIWFYRKMWNEKYDFYKTKVANLFLKCFINKLEFHKRHFETQFCRLAHFMKKLVWGLYAYYLDTFFETWLLHGVFKASRCQMSHLRWRVCKLNLTRLSQDWLVATIDHQWRDYKPTQGHPSTLCWTCVVVLEPW